MTLTSHEVIRKAYDERQGGEQLASSLTLARILEQAEQEKRDQRMAAAILLGLIPSKAPVTGGAT